MRAAFHLLLSPEVNVRCTTAQNKRLTSEVINPEVKGKERGVKMTRAKEREKEREGERRRGRERTENSGQQ